MLLMSDLIMFFGFKISLIPARLTGFLFPNSNPTRLAYCTDLICKTETSHKLIRVGQALRVYTRF